MKLKHFLLTAFVLFTGMSGVYAERYYVGFANGNTHGSNLSAALGDATTNDTVFVAAGLYVATTTEFVVKQNVTLIGGYAKGDNVNNLNRRYPGQFVPFDSSDLSATTKFTILDGNSYQSTYPEQKHRVITVNAGGVVDGCLIRNGHVRNSNGGGVLLDGGKLYNSIVRGNVAMSKPDTIESLGGGVFIKNGGELVNCLVAYNMANDGYGVAAGEGGGKMINNTITANTYAPVFVKIPATTGFQMYSGSNTTANRPGGEILKWAQPVALTSFYISRILTTQGQFAVFCAAMDIPIYTYTTDVYGQLNLPLLDGLQEPILKGGTVGNRYGVGEAGGNIMLASSAAGTDASSLLYVGGVWHPAGDTATVEYPVGNVLWNGMLAYSVWLGGGLPTEAQWEFAARCNPDGSLSDNLFSGAYGSAVPVSAENKDTVTWRILDTIAWVHPTVSIDTAAGRLGQLGVPSWTSRPHEVARKRPNAMGIYDMTGNMTEACADYLSSVAVFPYSSPYTNPIRTISDPWRASRGGAYDEKNRKYLPLSYRGGFQNGVPGTKVSFRPIVAF